MGWGVRHLVFDNLAPRIKVSIEDNVLSDDATKYVQSVKIEGSLDKATMIEMIIANPIKTKPGTAASSELLWTAHKAWAPGNLIHIDAGYGAKPLKRIGSG